MGQIRGGFRYQELARAEVGDNVWIIVSLRKPDNELVVAIGNIVQAAGREKMMYNAAPIILPHKDALEEAGNCLLAAVDKLEEMYEREAAARIAGR
jgi:hypothetical protein